MYGMQRELQPYEKKQGINNLVKAAEYLNSAIEILEDAGDTTKADQLLRILGKIAMDTKVKSMPSLQAFLDHGVTPEDFKGLSQGDAFAKARVNTAFRKMGYTDREIASFIGPQNMMDEKESEKLLNPEGFYNKLLDWIQNPKEVSPASKEMRPGDEFSISSLSDKGSVDDLLNVEIGNDPLEVTDEEEKTFEDSD